MAQYMTNGIFVLACLVFGTNIIVEVIKKTLPKVPTTYVALAVSEGLTLAAFFAGVSYLEIALRWYYVVAAVVFGIFVAYGAMFGFDKFKDAFQKLKNYKK